MLKVYVAGKYSDNNVIDVLKNIGLGERVCAELFMAGYAPFCPWHDKSYVMLNPEADFTVQQFYDYSIAWLLVSDAVFLLPNWKESKGTRKEIEIAQENKIPIFEYIEDLNCWRDGY